MRLNKQAFFNVSRKYFKTEIFFTLSVLSVFTISKGKNVTKTKEFFKELKAAAIIFALNDALMTTRGEQSSVREKRNKMKLFWPSLHRLQVELWSIKEKSY